MAINFPSNPVQGQTYTFNNNLWVYNGYAWVSTTSLSIIGSVGATGPTGSQGPTGATGSLAAGTASGTILTFTEDRVYGTLNSPETGSISANVTGGLLGVTNIIIHNSTISPTFSSQYKKLSGSGIYATGSINYIYCTYIASNEIIYAINQRS